MASGHGVVEINFGDFPGTNEGELTVTGQASISATSKVEIYLMGDDFTTGTGAHTVKDHRYFASLCNPVAGTPTAATGFIIYAYCAEKLQGKYKLRFIWVD